MKSFSNRGRQAGLYSFSGGAPVAVLSDAAVEGIGTVAITAPAGNKLARRRWSYPACLALVLPLVVLWSLATPVLAVFDGPAQLFAAAAAVRGEFRTPLVNIGIGKEEKVSIPGKIAALGPVAACLVSASATPANCAKPAPSSNRPTEVTTQFNRYPPLPYFLYGWPTLIFSGKAAYWGVTLAAAVVNSCFLALGLWALLEYSPNLGAVLGWLLVLTPEALYLAGSVSDSGFEISTAVASWATILSTATKARPPRRLVVLSTLSVCALMLARPASPVWVVILALVAAVVAGKKRLLGYLRQPAMWWGTIAIIASGLAAVAYRQIVGSPTLLAVITPSHRYGFFGALVAGAAPERSLLEGMVGTFLNSFVPLVPLICWVGAFFVLVGAAIAFSRRRIFRVEVALGVLILLLPVLANAAGVNRIGVWWQARDTMPFAVGLPLLMAMVLPDKVACSKQGRRLVGSMVPALAFANSATFVWLVHRYANGLDGSWNPATFRWHPPGGAVALSVAFVVMISIHCYLVIRRMYAPRGRPEAPPALLTS